MGFRVKYGTFVLLPLASRASIRMESPCLMLIIRFLILRGTDLSDAGKACNQEKGLKSTGEGGVVSNFVWPSPKGCAFFFGHIDSVGCFGYCSTSILALWKVFRKYVAALTPSRGTKFLRPPSHPPTTSGLRTCRLSSLATWEASGRPKARSGTRTKRFFSLVDSQLESQGLGTSSSQSIGAMERKQGNGSTLRVRQLGRGRSFVRRRSASSTPFRPIQHAPFARSGRTRWGWTSTHLIGERGRKRLYACFHPIFWL